MRKAIAIIILSLCITVGLFASNLSDLTIGMTNTQKQQFLNNALSVIPKNVSISTGFGSAYTNQYGYTFGSATSRTTEYLDWDAYKGSSQISRASFYKLTNQIGLYNSLVQSQERVQKKHKSGTYLTIGGGVVTGVGLGVMCYGLIRSNPYSFIYDRDDYNAFAKKSDTIMWWGIGIALAGIIPLGIGIEHLLYNESDNVSVSFAMGIADAYNESLATSIKLSY